MNPGLLKTFCSVSPIRPNLSEPWSWGNFTYASDGRVIIRVPKLESIPVPEEEPANQKKVENYFLSDESDGNYLPLPLPPLEGWGKLCPNCGGSGKTHCLICPCCDNHIRLRSIIVCEECDGKGRILWEQQVAFGRHCLNQFYVDQLAVLPSVMISQHKSDPMGPVSIRFDGGDGRLSPMRPKESHE